MNSDSISELSSHKARNKSGVPLSHHILQDIGQFAFLQVGPLLLQHTVLVELPSELLVAPFMHSGLGSRSSIGHPIKIVKLC